MSTSLINVTSPLSRPTYGAWPQPNNVEATDEVVTSGAAQAERWDTYMSDNVPAKTGANDQPAGERTQGGKCWYDTQET